jgi:hypothetical protein
MKISDCTKSLDPVVKDIFQFRPLNLIEERLNAIKKVQPGDPSSDRLCGGWSNVIFREKGRDPMAMNETVVKMHTSPTEIQFLAVWKFASSNGSIISLRKYCVL